MRPVAWSLLLALLLLTPLSMATTTDDGSPDRTEDRARAPLDVDTPFSDLGGQDEPVFFTNVSEDVGLSTSTGNYFAWGDYDSDGNQDLLVNGRKLFRNGGPPGYTFTDVTSATGLDRTSRVNVGVWGDYDNDGDLDVYLAGGGWTTSSPTRNDYLFRNDGGPDWTFTDVTAAAGDVVDDYPSTAAAWGDLDGDGHLDLYVANYENEAYEAWPDTLWHNDGDGTFTDVSVAWGIRSVQAEPGRGVAFCDYDNDGDVDVHVSNYRIRPNHLWRNDGTGRLTNVASQAGVTGDGVYHQGYGPYYGHTIGASWADWNNDGLMDIWEANLVHKYVDANDIRGYICDDSKFYLNNGPPNWDFADVRSQTGIPTKPIGGAGTYIGDELYDGIAWADFDNDGDVDVFMPQVYDLNYAHSYLYLNRGDGTFDDVGPAYGVGVWNTYGAAWADYDNDGDLDLVTGGKNPQAGGRTQIHLYRNSGNSNNWLKVLVRSPHEDRVVEGTRVTVRVGNTTMTRDVEGGTGSHAQMNDMPLEFGLGKADKADTVSVVFPSGFEVAFVNVAANATLTATEHQIEGPPPDLLANSTSPWEDESVRLSTNDRAEATGVYTGYHWDLDGDGIYELHTQTDNVTTSWSRRGIYHPRLAVATEVSGDSFLWPSRPPLEIDVRNRLPVAVAGDDVTIAEDQVLVLDGSSSRDSPSDLAGLEYRWVVDGDDRGWSTAATTEVVWRVEGGHNVDLFVRDDDGAVSSDRARVTVVNLPPVVADPGNMTVSEDEQALVHTTATDTPSDVGELLYRIDFGDGNVTGWIAEARRTHVYRASGVKEVRVDAKDGDGAIGRVWFNVTVENVVPTCSVSLLVTDLEEDEEFTAYGSVSDTYSDSETLRWRFDFGDGNATDWRRKPVARVPHVYTDEGTYEVTMYVIDDDGAVNTSAMQVAVGNVGPTVTLLGPVKALDEDEAFTLNAEATDTASDLPVLMYRWDFGDGTVLSWSNVSSVGHLYKDPGTYTVTVTVGDDEGDQDETTLLVRVDNVPPTAGGTQNRTTVNEDEAVGFDALLSTDTPSDLPNLEYSWTWSGEVRYGVRSTFSWSEAGSYTVVLTVIDDDGAIDEGFFQVTVVNVVPGGIATVDRTEAKVGEALTFNAVELADTPSDLRNLTVTWTFDDGTILSGRTVTHRFSEGGEHSVTATIRDDDGAKVERVRVVSVEEGPSALVAGSGLLLGVVIAIIIIVVVAIALYRYRASGQQGGPDAKVEDLDQEGPIDDNGDPGVEADEGTDEPSEDGPSERETQLNDEDQ